MLRYIAVVAIVVMITGCGVAPAPPTLPEEVLKALNAMFPMEDHAGMYFTMWYGVYDRSRRELTFASAGHHPAFLVPAERQQAIALRTRSGLVGADPGTRYRVETISVPAASALYLFSDGVFEIVTKDGIEWSLNDFVPRLLGDSNPGTCQRLFKEVRGQAHTGGLDDDFSLLLLNFD